MNWSNDQLRSLRQYRLHTPSNSMVCPGSLGHQATFWAKSGMVTHHGEGCKNWKRGMPRTTGIDTRW
jgi:hypothetical protein